MLACMQAIEAAGPSQLASAAAPTRGVILTVAAQKGGVGKTTLAYELAAVLNGVLIDLDFHGGGATNLWGFDPLAVTRAPLLDALERGPEGRPPRLKRGPSRPDLVPSHPDLSAARLDADAVAEALEAWAVAWGGRALIVDTHPGAHWTTDGAVGVADLVVSPIAPGRREVAATEAMLREHEDYPILLVPSMVPPSPPAQWIDALNVFSQREHVHLGPPISEHRWLRRRMLTSAVTLQCRPGARTRRAAAEYEAVARRAIELCQTPTPA
jgi:chromosome partitioning protein